MFFSPAAQEAHGEQDNLGALVGLGHTLLNHSSARLEVHFEQLLATCTNHMATNKLEVPALCEDLSAFCLGGS